MYNSFTINCFCQMPFKNNRIGIKEKHRLTVSTLHVSIHVTISKSSSRNKQNFPRIWELWKLCKVNINVWLLAEAVQSQSAISFSPLLQNQRTLSPYWRLLNNEIGMFGLNLNKVLAIQWNILLVLFQGSAVSYLKRCAVFRVATFLWFEHFDLLLQCNSSNFRSSKNCALFSTMLVSSNVCLGAWNDPLEVRRDFFLLVLGACLFWFSQWIYSHVISPDIHSSLGRQFNGLLRRWLVLDKKRFHFPKRTDIFSLKCSFVKEVFYLRS